MNTHVEFRSDAFPAYASEEEEINPGRWGKRLAEFISAALKSRGIAAHAPAAEDWGWMIEIENDAFPLWIGCGNYEQYPDGFLCFVEPSKPFVRRWFKKVATEHQVLALTEALDSILSSEPSIHSMRWWTDEELNNPRAEQAIAADRPKTGSG